MVVQADRQMKLHTAGSGVAERQVRKKTHATERVSQTVAESWLKDVSLPDFASDADGLECIRVKAPTGGMSTIPSTVCRERNLKAECAQRSGF